MLLPAARLSAARALLRDETLQEEDEMGELGQFRDLGNSEPSRLISGVPRRHLLLDPGERRILDVEMQPLATGELKLLIYLGSCPGTWHSSDELALRVYARKDPAGRQLVWTYASSLRRKVARELPTLITLCRRRGYSCLEPVRVVAVDAPDVPTTNHPYTR
jgi:DNA-binding response OmpR family regulator